MDLIVIYYLARPFFFSFLFVSVVHIQNVGNFPLPALSNPVFQEGAYENPEDVHKDKNNRSGIRSIGNHT